MVNIKRHIFLLSSHQNNLFSYRFNNLISNLNIKYWTIVIYYNGNPRIISSSCHPETRTVIQELLNCVKTASSSIASVQFDLSEPMEKSNIFDLNFLGYNWTLNASYIYSLSNSYQPIIPYNEMLKETDNIDFQLLQLIRKHMIEYYLSSPKKSLIESVRYSCSKLLQLLTSKYEFDNFILSNGYLSFAVTISSPYYLLIEERDPEELLILSSFNDPLEQDFIKLNKLDTKKAKLLVFSGQTLILNGDIPA